MANILLPRRFLLCGVPVTYELLLRLAILALTIGALIAASKPKVLSILKQANVVSVSMVDSTNIPVPGTLICGGRMDHVDVQILTRGIVYSNGTVGPDDVRLVTPDHVRFVNATDLNLRANGDWPRSGHCVILDPKDLYFAKNTNGLDRDALESIIFVAQSNDDFVGQNDDGLSIAMWDGNVPMEDQQPIWTSIPSINTLTFVYSEHTLLNETRQTHFTLQKQNLRQIGGFQNKKVIGRVVISPDTFYVTRYIDKPSYTWVDLAGALGGMASLALAVWIFLFGSGKYKSWGVMQRYILQTSPNSRRYREKEVEPRSSFSTFKRFFQKQLSRLDSSAENELDHVPLQSPTFQNRHQRMSLRYNTAATTNYTKGPTMSGFSSNPLSQVDGMTTVVMDRNDFAGHASAAARYSMESSGNANFYFSDQGTPGSRSLQPLAPINENEVDDAELQVEELIRLIDLRIDERMWSLERTLSRYYLDGFRLRNYSAPQSNAGTYYFKEGEYNNAHPATFGSFDPSAGQEHGFPMEIVVPPEDKSPTTLTEAAISNNTTSPQPPPVGAPSYPPRPQTEQKKYTVVEGSRAAIKEEISEAPSIASQPSSTVLNTNPTNVMASLSPPGGFPQRKDMRGTIRRAVERLQHEWPQSQAYETYVPRTRYQGRTDNSHSNSNNNQGYGHNQGNSTGSTSPHRDESPPRY